MLQQLVLSANKLNSIGGDGNLGIFSLANLTHLDVSSNDLTVVPAEIGRLTLLKVFFFFFFPLWVDHQIAVLLYITQKKEN